MTNKVFMRQRIAELNPEAILWEDLDDAVIGMSNDLCVVYQVELMQQEFMRQNDWTEEEAEEYIEYNVLGAHVGEYTPIHIWKINY